MNTASTMQSNQLKIDAFCRPITAAQNDQPQQPAVPEQRNEPIVPSRKRRIIIHDSDSDEGRAIVQSPGGKAEIKIESSAAMQAPAKTTTAATVTDSATGRAVPRSIHTETVTEVYIHRRHTPPNLRIAVLLTHQPRHRNQWQKR
jgi:hypothetical protein